MENCTENVLLSTLKYTISLKIKVKKYMFLNKITYLNINGSVILSQFEPKQNCHEKSYFYTLCSSFCLNKRS